MSVCSSDSQRLLALLTATHLSLGLVPVFHDRYPMTVASKESWGLQHCPGITFTDWCNGLSEPPCRRYRPSHGERFHSPSGILDLKIRSTRTGLPSCSVWEGWNLVLCSVAFASAFCWWFPWFNFSFITFTSQKLSWVGGVLPWGHCSLYI